MIDGEPRQVIAAERRSSLEVRDLREVDRDALDGYVQRLAVAEAQRPFDLSRDPLLRVTLLCAGTHDVVLLTDTPSAAQEDSAREAVDRCPSGALSVVED